MSGEGRVVLKALDTLTRAQVTYARARPPGTPGRAAEFLRTVPELRAEVVRGGSLGRRVGSARLVRMLRELAVDGYVSEVKGPRGLLMFKLTGRGREWIEGRNAQ